MLAREGSPSVKRRTHNRLTQSLRREKAEPMVPFQQRTTSIFPQLNSSKRPITTLNKIDPIITRQSEIVTNVSGTNSYMFTSARGIKQPPDATSRYEEILETFLNNSSMKPLFQNVESTIKEILSAKDVIFWQDIPSLQRLYSERLKKVVGHTKGLIGHSFYTRGTLKLSDATSHTAYSAEIDGSGKSQLIFPLWDYTSSVTAIVQVIYEPTLQIECDDDFITYFMKKFKIYSGWLSEIEMPHAVLLGLSQIMELEQFLLLFQKKVTALFGCRAAEIWKMDKSSSTITLYRKNEKEIADGRAGIAGETFRKGVILNCARSKIQSSYHAPVDGDKDESVLALPVTDGINRFMYVIALRGKHSAPVFTLTDEKMLKKIAPYLIVAFANIQKFSSRERSTEIAASEHNCVTDLISLCGSVERKKSTSVAIAAIEKLEHLVKADRSSLFVYDRKTDHLVSIYQSGLKNPLKVHSDRGVVGATFREATMMNIPDAYEDQYFDSTTDLETGYMTKGILSVPIMSIENKPLGVIQLINKLDGRPFGGTDIGFAEIFSRFIGLLLDGVNKYSEYERVCDQYTYSTSAVSSTMSCVSSTKATLQDLLRGAKNVVGATNISLFFVDEVLNVLTSYIVDGPKIPDTLPLTQGLAAEAYTKRTHVLVNDPYRDARFNKIPDFQTGFKTQSVVALPVFSVLDSQKVIAVLEVINKRDGPFDPDDLETLETYAKLISIVIDFRRTKNICDKGKPEIEMNKWLGEIERKSFICPKKLLIETEKAKHIFTNNFICMDWNGIGLFKIAFSMFGRFGLLERYQITNEMMFSFLYELRERYREVPYHNWLHAVDVLQFLVYELVESNFHNILTTDELLALCISALSHDIDHPATDNQFERANQTPHGILYKETSPNEMNHCSVIISIISKNDILHAVTDTDKKRIWENIIHLILSTNMKKHTAILMSSNDTLDEGPVNLSNQKHRQMAMVLLLKIADLGNVCRPFDCASDWTDALREEMMKQKGLEEIYGINCTSKRKALCMEDKVQWEIDFIEHYCIPLYKLITRILPELNTNLEFVKQNLEKWRSQLTIVS